MEAAALCDRTTSQSQPKFLSVIDSEIEFLASAVFYFHDYVDEYLYRHPALMNAKAMSKVLGEMGEETVVLIVSDGGAARIIFDSERVESAKI